MVTSEQRLELCKGSWGGAFKRPCVQGCFGGGLFAASRPRLAHLHGVPSFLVQTWLFSLRGLCGLPNRLIGSRAWELHVLLHWCHLPEILDRGEIPQKWEISQYDPAFGRSQAEQTAGTVPKGRSSGGEACKPQACEVGAPKIWTRDRGVAAMSLGTVQRRAATPLGGSAPQGGVTAGCTAWRVPQISGCRGWCPLNSCRWGAGLFLRLPHMEPCPFLWHFTCRMLPWSCCMS